MTGFLEQVALTIRLNFRNRMALIYGYAMPLVFLCAFQVLYRAERVPLVAHWGELLTVTVLGGASIGFPTTLVSERELGVWRRYRLAPRSAVGVVGAALVARFGIVVTSGLAQFAVAKAIGMPWPAHPLGMLVAFAFTAIAFLGLGLEIAMLAENVPAVQALGQCIFLPMLVIGGVAVRIATLPDWAQHLSLFFPGRYAVDALQVCMNGKGIDVAGFDLLALGLTGVGAGIAGIAMFRWDMKQNLIVPGGRAWAAGALAGWACVGLLAESRGRAQNTNVRGQGAAAPASLLVSAKPVSAGASGPTGAAASSGGSTKPIRDPAVTLPERWQDVTLGDVGELAFERLPPDTGVISPMAAVAELPVESAIADLETIRERLPDWEPGKVADPVQRVRNYLYVAAVPDVLELEDIEGFIPGIVLERMLTDYPKNELIKLLYWVGMHPEEGDASATMQLTPLGLSNSGNTDEARGRVQNYALKLLGRLTGKIKPR